ncbi:LytR/AlgR family response regulator transcription factor [Pseudoalteromonas sp. S16_S37]|uniref:LytR/AlgR family response regulator transcription factor n=1 Tax=Pseudoalteromonas sp. S16_S37 TaxID=2720228 RepID=UPI001680FAED|nr:LytTR family DNA-binding domain-containing protein [Pseudoalteromonas sp. S16_S37]MBD1583027.1 LytTR family transcriptional regulator [Pseudoalteromonas sp. S16_S37]
MMTIELLTEKQSQQNSLNGFKTLTYMLNGSNISTNGHVDSAIMIRITLINAILLLVFCALSFVAHAQDKLLFLPYNHGATICDVDDQITENTLLSFNDLGCVHTTLKSINPQSKSIWVKSYFDLPNEWLQRQKPYGLYISGKAASLVYLNEQLLGANGYPATSPPGTEPQEIAGKMDSVFYIPDNLLKNESNELIMYMSGHHSLIELDSPMHLFAIGQYGSPKRFIQNHSELGLILVGAFFVGALYFFILSLGGTDIPAYRIFAAMCFIAACQLSAEISRKFIDYSYMWHDIRLISITTLSFIFGTLVLLYSSKKLARKHAVHWVYIGVLTTAIVLVFAPGFDTKTTAAIFIPLLISLIQLMYYWLKNKSTQTLRWLLFQFSVAVTIVISAASFHEIIHFIIIGLLLCYLFIQQAGDIREQQNRLHYEQARLAKLEYKLAQNTQAKVPTKLEISIAGKIEYITTTDIAFCKAAGDYVEIFLKDRSEKLFSGSLKHLETVLPDTFLRVHRSYIVNLAEVVSLSSNMTQEGGVNMITLTTQHTVPVSRRLMPTVKDTLKQQI